MQPHHTGVAPDERHDCEEENVRDDEGDEDVPAAREPDREDEKSEHGNPERVTRDHRAGPVPRLALEPQAADRTGLVHRERTAPHVTGEAPRATAPHDGPHPAHVEKYCRMAAATTIATRSTAMRISGS